MVAEGRTGEQSGAAINMPCAKCYQLAMDTGHSCDFPLLRWRDEITITRYEQLISCWLFYHNTNCGHYIALTQGHGLVVSFMLWPLYPTQQKPSLFLKRNMGRPLHKADKKIAWPARNWTLAIQSLYSEPFCYWPLNKNHVIPKYQILSKTIP